MKKISLLIIDPQIDFCEPSGALYVPGAEGDMIRLANFIDRKKNSIDEIHVTLDSHHYVHIANPIFWQDSQGNHPAPFTQISQIDVESGKWSTTDSALQNYGLSYVRQLKINGRYQLTIWPPHCLIGSRGHAVYPRLFDELLAWENQYRVVNYINKGSHLLTEHYSAIKADVPAIDDEATQLNHALIDTLKTADLVLIAGEARTHCVANTVRDLAEIFAAEKSLGKFVLLTDAMSDIPGFESIAQDFLSEMNALGLQLQTTDSMRF